MEFGTDRVLGDGGDHIGSGSAADFAAALLSAVRRDRGARQSQDDVTVMVVRAIRW